MKFLFLPAEHDPDSYIRELGAEAFSRQIEDAMPLSQFLINEVTAENDLGTAEGRARAQFEAKPLLQAMPPSALRLQIVRTLAQLTHTTPAEIETLFELSKPVSPRRAAPASGKRTPPVELERQVLRLLVAHPALAAELDEAALATITHFAPDGGAMLNNLIAASRTIGAQPNFAALVEALRTAGISDFDALIAEIVAEPEMEIEVVRLELAGAVRQSKMKVLKSEQEQLAASGLVTEQARMRYRELSALQEELRRQAEAEIGQR
jgi:DNA primase